MAEQIIVVGTGTFSIVSFVTRPPWALVKPSPLYQQGILDCMEKGSKKQVQGAPYGTVAIRESKLEPWPNPHPERPYLISLDIPEFTCLCPRSGFPDFAVIKIRYQPAESIVELKSLKLYINAYRDRSISHEAAVNQILEDLVELLQPRWMRVTGDFNVRGNIKTVVRAEHGRREQP